MIESLERRTFLSLSPFKQELTSQTGMVSNVVAGDFDGNGTKDLATNGGVALLNNGQGAFRRVLGYFGRSSIDTTNGPLTVAADFNGDGMDDIAGAFGGKFAVFFARGKGLFHLPVTLPHVTGAPLAIDANKDGRIDIAISGNNCLQILMNTGRNSFDVHTYISPRVGSVNVVVPGPLAAGDFDGDGDLDIIGGAARIRTPIYFNDGDGGYTTTSTLKVQNHGVVAADFNRDHKSDLIVNNYVYLGAGDGTFGTGVAIPNTLYAVEASGDFNGDGRLDLVLPSIDTLDRRMLIFAGRGDGTFSELANLRPNAWGISGPVADFNADGKSDLVVFAQPSGGMTAPRVSDSYDGDYTTGDLHLVHFYQPDTIGILLS